MFSETITSCFAIISNNIATVSLLSLLSLLLFTYKNYKYDYWKKQGVNGPKPLPIVGNILNQIVSSYFLVAKERYQKFGKIFGLYELSNPVLSLADPELLRCVMVKDSDVFINRRENQSGDPLVRNMLISLRDEKWKKTRAIMSPTFTSGRIRKMTAIINGCVKSLMENIESKVNRNEEIDFKAVYGAYTMDVIASCAFATKTNSHKNPNDPFVKNAKDFFGLSRRRFLVVLVPKFVRNIFNLSFVPSTVTTFFKTTTKAIIEERKNKNIIGDDFLQLLLDSEKTHNLMNTVKDINAEQLNKENQEEIEQNAKLLITQDSDLKLTEDEVLAQCMIFFVAGYETTASLLSYTTYALTVNPDCQELLYKEVKQYFDLEGEITYETINKMKYLNAVINETLRHYPPLIRVDREASKDYTLPNTNVTVPKGGLIYIPIYDIQHDPENFPEPDLFKPERFLPENIDSIKPYTFLPFGGGPRNCIGMRFALMEAKLALSNVILKYKFVKSENTDVPLKMYSLPIAFLPIKRVIAKCEKRC